MLTPQERAALACIEQQLVLEDPAFAARLRHTRPPRARRPVILVALGLILLGLSLLCLACGAGYAVLRFVPGPDLA